MEVKEFIKCRLFSMNMVRTPPFIEEKSKNCHIDRKIIEEC